MNQFIIDFLKRIHYQDNDDISFTDLPRMMKQFAKHIPFENIDIIQKQDVHLNEEFLKQKIITHGRGGLCYELNPFFYYVLKELGFKVHMIKATINSSKKNTLKNTHIATVLYQKNKRYLIDVGFGANQALQPVPFTGEFVHAPNGDYRVRELVDENMFFYEKHQNGELAISYRFNLEQVDVSDVNDAKNQVTNHPDSPFNKSLLMTKTTDNGHKTLTDTTYTIVENGDKYKEVITSDRVKQLGGDEFQIKI